MIVETQKLYDEIASLRQQLADIKEELQYVLNDWNALVRAIGAKKNGTAIGEAHLLVKQLAEAQERIKKLEHKTCKSCKYENDTDKCAELECFGSAWTPKEADHA